MLLKSIITILALMTFSGAVIAHALLPGVPSVPPALENGDMNDDGSRNLTDVIYMLNYLYLGGPEPASCAVRNANQDQQGETATEDGLTTKTNGDLDADGTVGITDVILFFHWLFSGGAEPSLLLCDSLSSA